MREYGVRPRKRLSQNFVIDPFLVKKVIDLIPETKTVLELGSGLGTLSYYISRLGIRYSIHVEIDPILASITDKMIGVRGITICGDGLLLEWNTDVFVSNIPYRVTSDILVKIARTNSIRKAIVVVQKEVADRITAEPGTKEYGRLTVLLGLLFTIEKGPVYPPSSFHPPPEVYSQMIILERRRLYDKHMELVEELTRILFHKRRKKLSKVLREEYGIDSRRVLEKIGVQEDIRVYQLRPGDLERIAAIIYGIN